MKKKVIAQLFIKNESIEEFKNQANLIIQKTRNEKGCLIYNLFQDISNPGNFYFTKNTLTKMLWIFILNLSI